VEKHPRIEVIDEELHTFSRRVEFAEANFSTYSIDLLRLYLSICSEIDVAGKLLCQRIGAHLEERPTMDDYRRSLKSRYPHLSSVKITLRPLAQEILPWETWNEDQNLDWWKKHQLVKHQRDQYFAEANRKNVLFAGGGLLVFLTYWHQPELWNYKVNPAFNIFEVEGLGRGIQFMPRYKLADFPTLPMPPEALSS